MKKPWPLMARSRVLLVGSMLPWVNCCATLEIFTPAPFWVWLTPCGDTANSSANSERDCLKPVVLELAILLAVTFRSLCAALMPLSAMPNDMGSSWVNSDDLLDVAKRDRAQLHGIEGQSGAGLVDAHA